MSTPAKIKIHALVVIYLQSLMQAPGLDEEDYAAAEELKAQLSKTLP